MAPANRLRLCRWVRFGPTFPLAPSRPRVGWQPEQPLAMNSEAPLAASSSASSPTGVPSGSVVLVVVVAPATAGAAVVVVGGAVVVVVDVVVGAATDSRCWFSTQSLKSPSSMA